MPMHRFWAALMLPQFVTLPVWQFSPRPPEKLEQWLVPRPKAHDKSWHFCASAVVRREQSKRHGNGVLRTPWRPVGEESYAADMHRCTCSLHRRPPVLSLDHTLEHALLQHCHKPASRCNQPTRPNQLFSKSRRCPCLRSGRTAITGSREIVA